MRSRSAPALSRIARAGVTLDVADMKVPYRETLAGSIEVEGRHKKQSGGHGQFGVATVRFEPLPEGSGFEFESEMTGGVIPKNLVPAVGACVREGMERGGQHGYPLVDVRAVCTGGKTHAVDSSEMSFKMAGSLALREAVARVGVEVLEPVSLVRCTFRRNTTAACSATSTRAADTSSAPPPTTTRRRSRRSSRPRRSSATPSTSARSAAGAGGSTPSTTATRSSPRTWSRRYRIRPTDPVVP